MTVTSAKAITIPAAASGDVVLAADIAALSPEAVRRLAADLAPHLIAMRAVTAGTSYADTAKADSGPSPATTIFIAGMLSRMSAST